MRRLIFAALLCGCGFDPGSVCVDAGSDCDLAVFQKDSGQDSSTASIDLQSGQVDAGGEDQARADMSETAAADMTTVPDLLPQQPYYFDPIIQKDLDALGCASGSCHGTKAPVLISHPITIVDVDANYNALAIDTHSGPTSLILTKTLATSGIQHADNSSPAKPFASTGDPVYQRWLLWINAGAMKR